MVVYASALVIGVVGSVLVGFHLWHSSQSQKPRLLTMGLVGVGIAFAALFPTIALIPF